MGERTRRSTRPRLAFAYRPDLTEGVFTEHQLGRIIARTEILDNEPLTEFTSDGARRTLAEAEVLVTGWGVPVIDASVLSVARNLRLIAHSAGAVKYFLAPEVFTSGIAITSAVSANAIPVAEFTLASILFANKRVLAWRDLYARERSHLVRHPMMGANLGNYRRTIGIIGASRIGLRVIELLRPFDFEVLLYDPYARPEQARAIGAELVELDELLARSDVASLHAPALPSTRQMIDARRLGLLRDGATFINTARGSIVDQDALERELVAGRISAVIDVTEPEVLPADSPLYELPNVLLTPHIAGAVGLERERLGELVAAEVERYAGGEALRHALDFATLERQA